MKESDDIIRGPKDWQNLYWKYVLEISHYIDIDETTGKPISKTF